MKKNTFASALIVFFVTQSLLGRARLDASEKEVAIEAVEGKSVNLPCDVTPPGHDKVYMVFWFHHGSGYPIYSFDVRGKPLSQARHWSAPEVFGSRAYFRTVSEPAVLVIDDIRRHDEGVYRCRVDFRNAQTRSFKYNLTVVVPPEQPTILDKWGRQLNGTVGPYEENDEISLTCRTVGGHPTPKVRWLVNAVVVDEHHEQNAGDVIENKLKWKPLSRQDLDAIFTCQAKNTILVEPRITSVLLDLQLKPLTVDILKTTTPLIAEKRYEVSCKSTGSRPPAIITWYKGKRSLRRTKHEILENATISELSFVPTTEDDGKSITCRAENPNVTGLFLETSWKIDVVYPPQVSLNLGSTLNADDIKEGDDVYFECRVTANPHWRRLTWLHNNILLNHSLTGRIIHSNQSLVLQKVTKQSAGRYVCSAVNSEGETLSNQLHFRVQYAPICKNDKIMVVGASKGENIDVICEIESDPPAKSYRWKFNNSGETLDVEAERFAKTSNGTVSILRYTPISELDYGSLSCWAVNAIGHQVTPCVFQVVAAGKPFPVRNCTTYNQTSNSLEVACVSSFDGGLPQFFLVELFSIAEGGKSNHHHHHQQQQQSLRYNLTSHTEPYFFLDNLESEMTFRIVVYAVNSKGRSTGVVLEEVTFRDAEKRTASDGDLAFSPIFGMIIGGTLTVIAVIVLIIIRVRRSRDEKKSYGEEKVQRGGGPNTICSTPSAKPPVRSISPKEISDDRDPDIIPAKYELPGPFYNKSTNPNELLRDFPLGKSEHMKNLSNSDEMYHVYNNPAEMIDPLPRDLRPKDLQLERESLNPIAIKEKLMANRLPESCV